MNNPLLYLAEIGFFNEFTKSTLKQKESFINGRVNKIYIDSHGIIRKNWLLIAQMINQNIYIEFLDVRLFDVR